jgi:glycerol-3-phosphate acyltransferase PlsY
MTAQPWIVLLSAYGLGSIPTAYIITRFSSGQDIRKLGDGNIGAKNTFESVSKAGGIFVVLVDVGKGILAVLMAEHLTGKEEWILLSGLCAILGHDFSIFLKFQGGQGMAITTGVFLALFPQEAAVGLVIMVVMLAITRSWDLSCGTGFVSFLVMMGITGQTGIRMVYAIAIIPLIGAKKLVQAWRERRMAV